MQAADAKLEILPAGTETPLVESVIGDGDAKAIDDAAKAAETVDPKDAQTIGKVASAAKAVESLAASLPIHAKAWSVPPVAHVVAPYDKVLFPQARVAHEVEHMTHDDFASNADHHPAFHMCGRVGHAFRLFGSLHLSKTSWDRARELLLIAHANHTSHAPEAQS